MGQPWNEPYFPHPDKGLPVEFDSPREIVECEIAVDEVVPEIVRKITVGESVVSDEQLAHTARVMQEAVNRQRDAASAPYFTVNRGTIYAPGPWLVGADDGRVREYKTGTAYRSPVFDVGLPVKAITDNNLTFRSNDVVAPVHRLSATPDELMEGLSKYLALDFCPTCGAYWACEHGHQPPTGE